MAAAEPIVPDTALKRTQDDAGETPLAVPDYDCAFMERTLMEELRLYHHPVGVTLLFSDEEVAAYRDAHPGWCLPVRPMTFCQWEVAARMQGRTVIGTVDKLFCTNAQVSFGWRDIDDNEVKSQLKYCRSEAQARRFLAAKPRMKRNSVKAVAVSPLSACTDVPHVVHILADSMQAYHLAVDYMAAMDIHPLPTQILMSSSSCGGTVACWQSGLMNYTTPCSGSYNSGKMERGESSVLIPGRQIRAVVARLMERVAARGSSAVTSPGDFYPGADICKNCPLIHFKKGESSCPGCSAGGQHP